MLSFFILSTLSVVLLSWVVQYHYLKYPFWFYVAGYLRNAPANHSHSMSWTFPDDDGLCEAAGSSRPNIILIIADDLGVNDLSNGIGVSTPNIDAIGTNGIKFSNAYSGHATCAPSRAAIFTGKFPTRIGFEFTPVPLPISYIASQVTLPKNKSFSGIFHAEKMAQTPSFIDMVVPAKERFLSEYVKQRGYHTAYVGKWHLGGTKGSRPQDRGFDQSVAIIHGGSLYVNNSNTDVVNAYGLWDPADDYMRHYNAFFVHDHNGVKFTPDEYMTDYLAKQAEQAILEHAEASAKTCKPLFMTVAFNAPHSPNQALKHDYNDPEIAKIPDHLTRVYAAMIKALDRGVGRIKDALTQTGTYDNTLLLFTSDNGGATYGGLFETNLPYKGGKANFFEGGVRVPFLMQWPNRIAPAAGTASTSASNARISHVDIFATVASIANSHPIPQLNYTQLLLQRVTDTDTDTDRPSADEQVDGFDLMTLFPSTTSTVSTESTINNDDEANYISDNNISTTHHAQRSLFFRTGHYKSLIHGDWKLQLALHPPKAWFYHLRRDPVERINLVSELVYPQGTVKLVALYLALEQYKQAILTNSTAGRDNGDQGSLKMKILKVMFPGCNVYHGEDVLIASVGVGELSRVLVSDAEVQLLLSATQARTGVSQQKEKLAMMLSEAVEQCVLTVTTVFDTSTRANKGHWVAGYVDYFEDCASSNGSGSKSDKISCIHHTVAQQFCNTLLHMLRIDDEVMVPPVWPSLSESPVEVNDPYSEAGGEDSEFVYWSN